MLSITSSEYNRKVSIVGAGYVGASIAYALMIKELTREIVMIDINKKTVDAEVMDIRHGIPYMGSTIIYNGEYHDINDSDLIIVTAGRNRRSGEERLDMAADNIRIARNVAIKIEKYYTKGVILLVSNPVDVITYKMNEWLGLPNGMIFGTGCILDSSRFVNVLADYLKIGTDVINAQIIGEHGASQVPLWSKVTVAGIPLIEYCDAIELPFSGVEKHKIESVVLNRGTEIIEGKGKTHYGIATCVCYLADAILNKRPTIASVTSVLDGEYGIYDVSLSLPSIINYQGVERRLADRLNDYELTKLKESSKQLESICQKSS